MALLGVQAESRLLRELGHRGKGGLEYHRVATTSFGPMSLPTLMQPNHQLVAQGASQLESRWGLQMLWQCSQRRNQVTLGGVENSDFNFTLAGPAMYLCLSTEQRIHRIFKRQCRASGYKECALHKVGASSGLET
jgi:hypothetical protein